MYFSIFGLLTVSETDSRYTQMQAYLQSLDGEALLSPGDAPRELKGFSDPI